MTKCTRCDRQFELLGDQPPAHCPYCGESLEEAGATNWRCIARFGNLAEAGYFSNLLAERDIRFSIRQHDQFSAVDGAWHSLFVLLVPEPDAPRAADCIEEDLHGGQPADDDHDEPDPSYTAQRGLGDDAVYGAGSFAGRCDDPAALRHSSTRPVGSLVVPIVLLVAVGGLAYGVSQGMFGGWGGDDHRPTLGDALDRLSTPLVAPEPPAASRRQLRFDAARGLLVLDEDTNGDGRLDLRREYEPGQLVSEQRF